MIKEKKNWYQHFSNKEKAIKITWKNLEKRNGDGKGGGFEVVCCSPFDEFAAIAQISPFQLKNLPKKRACLRKQTERQRDSDWEIKFW